MKRDYEINENNEPYEKMSFSRLIYTLLFCNINLLLLTFVHAQNPARRTASISGRVTVSGKPVANVPVNLAEVNTKIQGARIIQSNGREMVDRLGYRTTTNADGIYLFTGLPAGDYQVSALSPAYVAEAKSQTHDGSKQITLDEGEALKQVDIALIRGGVITGRVTDEASRPQIARQIRLIEILESGVNVAAKVRGTITDDRGVYRIYGIRPGRYIINTGGQNDILASGSQGKKFELTYHPNTSHEVEAKVIEVKEGSEITGIDIKLAPLGKTYEVSGRVIEVVDGRAMSQIRISCVLIENQEADFGNEVTNVLTDTQGNFRLTGLRPGRYKLGLAHGKGESTPYYTEEKYFDIESNDLSGLEVVARRGGTLSGMLILEEGHDPSLIAKLYQANILLAVRRAHLQGDKLIAWKQTRPSPDGSFQFIGLPPGKAQLSFSPNNESFYLLRVELDGTTQPEGIDIRRGANLSGVGLIIAHGDGVVRGEVKIVGGSLPEGCSLSASAMKVGSGDIGKRADVDGKGRFLIEGLLPGEYVIYIGYSFRSDIAPSALPKMPLPANQNIYVKSGSETRFTITYDLSRKDQ
jgi:Carboxypeptidase regulatory-like domain